MAVEEFLSHVRDLGINLWLDGDDLRYSAPEEALTHSVRAELIARKVEILAFLRETQAVTLMRKKGQLFSYGDVAGGAGTEGYMVSLVGAGKLSSSLKDPLDFQMYAHFRGRKAHRSTCSVGHSGQDYLERG